MTKRNYFTAQNLDELKQEYRKLVFIHHPDCGGSTEIMQEVNAEYDYLNELLAKEAFSGDEEKYQTAVNVGEKMAKVIQAIVSIPEIEIEVCGAWLWVTGKTYPYKQVFKEKGFLWSKNKQAWYWRLPEDGTRRHKGNTDTGEVRQPDNSQKGTWTNQLKNTPSRAANPGRKR